MPVMRADGSAPLTKGAARWVMTTMSASPSGEGRAAEARAVDHQHGGHHARRPGPAPGRPRPAVQRRQPGAGVEAHALTTPTTGTPGLDAGRDRAGDRRRCRSARRPMPRNQATGRCVEPRQRPDAGLDRARPAGRDGQARGDDRAHRGHRRRRRAERRGRRCGRRTRTTSTAPAPRSMRAGLAGHDVDRQVGALVVGGGRDDAPVGRRAGRRPPRPRRRRR